ncbi:hypothetical protein BD626DRAFT_161709 [Schizophyllum amplum]|uniref:BTB domain-containing protein n=1 Tax=Schizophyllum amplum TaxID=97359 RepID=A0A550CPA3_9AGAR|nr:hypothetical protein BD626DRAFT_161709 [Auriculariopsis ampla]
MAAPAPAFTLSAAPAPHVVKALAADSPFAPDAAEDAPLGPLHPAFDAADADIELRSCEGTRYRIYARRLAGGSAFFRALLALPQPDGAPVLSSAVDGVPPHTDDAQFDDVLSAVPAMFDAPEDKATYASTSSVPLTDSPTHPPIPLPTPFTDVALEPVLHILSGRPTPDLDLAALDVALILADAWDAPGVLAALRSTLRALIPVDPIRAYGLARRHGWKAEAASASEATLTYELFAPPSPPYASTSTSTTDAAPTTFVYPPPIPPPTPLSILPTVHLLPLLRLHRARRDKWRELLDSPYTFVAGNGAPYFCGTCGVTALDNSPWRLLKHALVEGLERCPRGDTVRLMIGDPILPERAPCKGDGERGRSVEVGVGTTDGGVGAGPATPPPGVAVDITVAPVSPVDAAARACAAAPLCAAEAQACWDARCSKDGCNSRNYDRVETVKRLKRCLELLPQTIDNS